MDQEQLTKRVKTDAITGERRLRFVGTRERSAQASADVYRVASNKEKNTIFLPLADNDNDVEEEVSRFAIELDLARDRNASEAFENIHTKLYPLTRSLPELLHHLPQVIDVVLEESTINLATPDVLHLIGILARETRHELHPYVHSKLLPGLTQIVTSSNSSNAAIALPVHVVEAAFRAISQIVRYDTQLLLQEETTTTTTTIRHYYGPTLGHRTPLIRRLAGETFGLFVRKFDKIALKTHIKRVIRAFSSSFDLPQKLQQDAIEGISWLLFYATRGVEGRLHSKGIIILQTAIQCLSNNKVVDDNTTTTWKKKQTLIASLVSNFLLRVCDHVNNAPYFAPIWEILHQTLDDSVSTINSRPVSENTNQSSSSPNQQQQLSLKHILDLMEMCASFNTNTLLMNDNSNSNAAEQILSKIERLLLLTNKDTTTTNTTANSSSSLDVKESVLRLLCTFWKAQPTNSHFIVKVPQLLRNSTMCTAKEEEEESLVVPLYLAQNLLPNLPLDIALGTLVPSILSANKSLSLVVLHTVTTSFTSSTANSEYDDDDTLFYVDSKLKFALSSEADHMMLMNMCLYGVVADNENDVKRILYVLRCIPLLVNGSSNKTKTSTLKKILCWLTSTLKVVDERILKQKKSPNNTGDVTTTIVAKALILELTSVIVSCSSTAAADAMKKSTLKTMYSSVKSFLLDHPTSVWAMRGISFFLKALNSESLSMDDDTMLLFSSVDQVFDLLVPNLRQCNHYLRLYTLSILASLPRKNYVVNHTDIDFTGDLDEEPSTVLEQRQHGSTSIISGTCDLITILLSIESLPITMDNERRLTSCINRVEVLGRSGSLPVVYTEAAANHMLGIFSLKFAPIWPAATKAFAGLLTSSSSSTTTTTTTTSSIAEKVILNSLIQKVQSLLSVATPTVENTSTAIAAMICDDDDVDDAITANNRKDEAAIHHHANLCVQWEQSNGSSIDIFGRPEGDHVIMPKSRCTDEWTLFELVLGVMESVPEVVAKKSKFVVPLFVGFLHYEYFASSSSEDPDVRELCLSDQVDEMHNYPQVQQQQPVGKKSLNKKLGCFLKVFAAVSGPQQLYKHKLLAGIFFSLLSNPDSFVAQLAFDCLSRYKFVYVSPYKEHLQKLLKKGELRDALVGLDLSKDSSSCILEAQHRQQFIPILSRLLFGRLTAKGGGGKSSKDSPKLRRKAILSFFSKLATDEGELDYFIYLMIRAFVPFDRSIKCDYLEHGLEPSSFSVKQVTDFVKTVTVNDVAKIRYQKHIGFLNLISDSISQLGYGVYPFIDIFMPILLSMCEYAALQQTASSIHDAKLGDDEGSVNSNEDEEFAGIDESETLDIIDAGKSSCNFSAIRSLCYQRLSQLFLQFGHSFDFSPYSGRMWSALGAAIENLPSSVINAPQCPSLLRLLNDLSSDPSLLPMLVANHNAVESAFKCIEVTSQLAVVEVSLNIVDQLLTEGGIFDSRAIPDASMPMLGRQIVANNLHLLITQMSARLCVRSLRQGNMGTLAKKELSILCRVSDLIDPTSLASKGVTHNGQQETLDMLCGALMTFLSPERHEKEEVRVNILRILNNFLCSLSAVSAMKIFVPLSKLLGPFKSNAGIVSPEIRLLTIAALDKVSVFVGSTLGEVVSALKCLHTLDSRHVGEYNFEVVLPTLNRLGDISSEAGSWDSFFNEHDEWGAKIILPLLLHCLHALYSSDGVVSRGAFKALKTFVLVASKDRTTDSVESKKSTQSFSRVLETSMMPIVRLGILSKNDAVHRYYTQILCEVCRNFASSTSSSYYGDLSVLIRVDDIELDFFLNISHVQIHRRGRALARLRREHLTHNEANPGSSICSFTPSSLANVLLPLTLRPLYAEKPSEESYSLEAVATVGAIARFLSWSKYDSVLCDLLRQFPRYPNQERFFIGGICSMLDAFHFDVSRNESFSMDEDPLSDGRIEDDDNPSMSLALKSPSFQHADSSGAVWRALNQRIIPRTEELLKKHLTDKTGSRIQQLRSPIALALTKLFQKLPSDILDAKLPRLVLEVCTALRSRDSDCREIARETLAKMAASLGENHLALILKHLATTLTEGYQLHVRSAALHSVMFSLSKVYESPEMETANESRSLPFDLCIPAIMDLVQQDLFGVASEMKEVEYVEKRLIKEAMGSKSPDTLEIVCRCLRFNPSIAANCSGNSYDSLPSLSAVHNIVIPLLERLRLPDVTSSTIGKVRECLTKIVIGLAQNVTVSTVELMPFVHATAAPFLLGTAHMPDYLDGCSDDEYSDAEDSDHDDTERPIIVGRTGANGRLQETTTSNKKTGIQKPNAVAQWHPSLLMAPTDCKSARALNTVQKRDMQQVLDGESAPKLTGKARHGYLDQLIANNLNDPSKACGVIFSLSLLHSCLKKSKVNSKDSETLSMADPFIPMLTHCITNCENNDIVLLALKLMGHLLHWDLPSMKKYQKKLVSNVLKLLALTGGVLSSKHEVTHGCFKALTLLFDKHVLYEDTEAHQLASQELMAMSSIVQENLRTTSKAPSTEKLPLSPGQMKVLVSMLSLSVTDTDHHNSTFSLIKAMVSRRFLSAEFYDLMEKLLELSAQSLKAGVRHHASGIFMKFLVTYPLDHKRLLQHLQQIVLNIKYEYEEGRLSAIKLLDCVVGKLPNPLIVKHGKIFFFPLVLQLVNDESNSCREAVAHVITSLFQRSSMEQLQLYYDYMKRWFLEQGEGALSLRRTSAQLFGLLVESRTDFFVGRKNKVSSELVEMIITVLNQEVANLKEGHLAATQWETAYFCLVCFEKVVKKSFAIVSSESCIDIWVMVTECLVFPHPWVKQVSCRIIFSHLQGLDTSALDANQHQEYSSTQNSFIVKKSGSLFQIARNVCFQLNCADDQYNEALAEMGIKILTWISQRMRNVPHLCYKEAEMSNKDPMVWLVTRLSNMSKEKGNMRRSSVFKCFASLFCTSPTAEKNDTHITPYLGVMLEALHRPIVEEEGAIASSSNSNLHLSTPTTDLSKEVMNLLEERCGSEAFLIAYSKVKVKAREKKMARKQMALSEAINNPREEAKRKILKHTREKERKKRKIEERKASRGVFTKKPRML